MQTDNSGRAPFFFFFCVWVFLFCGGCRQQKYMFVFSIISQHSLKWMIERLVEILPQGIKNTLLTARPNLKSYLLMTRYWPIQYIPRNMLTVFALLCFVVVIHWLIFPYPSGLLHWHCGNLTIAPVPAKQPWWIWINTSREFIMNDCTTTTKQSTTKPCAYFLGYTIVINHGHWKCRPTGLIDPSHNSHNILD